MVKKCRVMKVLPRNYNIRNFNWVYYNCRIAVRRSAYNAIVKCPSCAGHCEYAGDRFPIPPKFKPREWQQLRATILQVRIHAREQGERDFANVVQSLKSEILKLEALPQNEGRLLTIKLLEKRLESICERGAYTGVRLHWVNRYRMRYGRY